MGLPRARETVAAERVCRERRLPRFVGDLERVDTDIIGRVGIVHQHIGLRERAMGSIRQEGHAR
jgi:hypothetical protein